MTSPVTFSLMTVLTMMTMAGQAGAGPNLQAGMWESLVRVEYSGSTFPIPVIKSKKCLSVQDPVPNTIKEGQACKMTGQKIEGDEVFWTVTCSEGKGVMTGAAKIQFKGDSYEGRMQVTIAEPGEGRELKMVYLLSGSRIGACP